MEQVQLAASAEYQYARILLGEYGNVRDERGRWESTAWLYWTTDEGLSWASSDFFIRAGVNKHIHTVSAPLSGEVFVTTGLPHEADWVSKPGAGGEPVDLDTW